MQPLSKVNIQILPNRFVVVDGVKIGRCTSDGKLEIKDKDRQRSRERGSDLVVVDVNDLLAVLCTTGQD